MRASQFESETGKISGVRGKKEFLRTFFVARFFRGGGCVFRQKRKSIKSGENKKMASNNEMGAFFSFQRGAFSSLTVFQQFEWVFLAANHPLL